MKNLVEYINESAKKTWFCIPDIDLSAAVSKKELKEWMDHGVYPDFRTDGMTDLTFYFTGKESVKYLLPWLQKYWDCKTILQTTNQVDGLYEASRSDMTKVYAVIDDIDMTEKLGYDKESKMKKAGVKMLYYPGKQSKYTGVMLCITENAFKTTAIDFLKEYCQGDEEDVIAAFPELKKYM